MVGRGCFPRLGDCRLPKALGRYAPAGFDSEFRFASTRRSLGSVIGEGTVAGARLVNQG